MRWGWWEAAGLQKWRPLRFLLSLRAQMRRVGRARSPLSHGAKGFRDGTCVPGGSPEGWSRARPGPPPGPLDQGESSVCCQLLARPWGLVP